MTAPAGWYPDPENASVLRWWTGTAWTADRTPMPGVVPGAVRSPASVVPAVVPRAADGRTIPASTVPRPAEGVPTGTVWVYLATIVPLLGVVPPFFIDWEALFVGGASTALSSGLSGLYATVNLAWIGGTLIALVVGVGSVLFAWLDWRELSRRGIPKPFSWGFAAFVFVLGIGVYVIGRTVVLVRRTGAGLAALWVWIATLAVSAMAGVILSTIIVQHILDLMLSLRGAFPVLP
ncbi:DUF2510 domain-containing protein [Microbacterium sp.]|uniref:DUF2510 domain-containing protein n=1 Tax=Microbacterium sp. TaxID=51671 RepID=UPI003A8A81B0